MKQAVPVPRSAVSVIPPYHPGKRISGASKLSSNENPFGCSPKAKQAIKKALSEVEIYPDGRGTALVQKLAMLHSIDPAQIILGNGSDEIMSMATASFMEPGYNAVIATPTFSQYEYSTRLFGGEVKKIPLKNGKNDLDAMLAAIDPDTRMVFVCNPNNPTGTYSSQKELERFIAQIPAHILLVLDEAYCEFATAADYPDSLPLLKSYPNLLILRTFSKIHGLAALRLGYGFASPEIIELFLRVKQPFNNNSLALAAGQAALNDTAFVQKTLNTTHRGMEYLTNQMDRLGLSYYPSQANFLCIHTPIPADEVYDHILSFGITIRSLRSFGMDNSIRVSIGTMKNLKAFVRGMESVCS